MIKLCPYCEEDQKNKITLHSIRKGQFEYICLTCNKKFLDREY